MGERVWKSPAGEVRFSLYCHALPSHNSCVRIVVEDMIFLENKPTLIIQMHYGVKT